MLLEIKKDLTDSVQILKNIFVSLCCVFSTCNISVPVFCVRVRVQVFLCSDLCVSVFSTRNISVPMLFCVCVLQVSLCSDLCVSVQQSGSGKLQLT